MKRIKYWRFEGLTKKDFAKHDEKAWQIYTNRKKKKKGVFTGSKIKSIWLLKQESQK